MSPEICMCVSNNVDGNGGIYVKCYCLYHMYIRKVQQIPVTSQECHGVSLYWKIAWLFCRLFRMTTKKNIRTPHYDQPLTLHEVPVIRKVFPCGDARHVRMSPWRQDLDFSTRRAAWFWVTSLQFEDCRKFRSLSSKELLWFKMMIGYQRSSPDNGW